MVFLATALLTLVERPLSLYGGLQTSDYEAFFADEGRGEAMFRVRPATQLSFNASIIGLPAVIRRNRYPKFPEPDAAES